MKHPRHTGADAMVPLDADHLEKARRHIYDAVGEIVLGGAGRLLSSDLLMLRRLEDALYQLRDTAEGGTKYARRI